MGMRLLVGGRHLEVSCEGAAEELMLRAAWGPAITLASDAREAPPYHRLHLDLAGEVLLDGAPSRLHLEVHDPFARLERHIIDCAATGPAGPILHAGAVVLRGHLVLLVGPSNIGKSTMTRELLRLGAHYLSDDLIFVRCDSVHGLSRTVQFDPIRSDAEAPSYLMDCDLTTYAIQVGREKSAVVPLWRGSHSVQSAFRFEPSAPNAKVVVVELQRGSSEALETLGLLERVRLLHEASLSSGPGYRGELPPGPTYRLSWASPEKAAQGLVGILLNQEFEVGEQG